MTPPPPPCGCPCHQPTPPLDEADEQGRCCRPRHCRRAGDCAGRYRDTHQLVGAVLELPGLCDSDRAQLERVLPELPALWLALRAMLVPGSAGDPGPARGTRSPPLPLRIDPLVTADLLVDELQRWEQVVRDRLGMDPPPVGGGTAAAGTHVARAAQLLTRAVPTLLALGPTPHVRWTATGTHTELDDVDGYDAACRLLAVHRTAQRVAGHTVLVHHLPTPCSRCETLTLRRLNGDDHVRCTTCGAVWNEDQYPFLVQLARAAYSD